MADGMTPDDEQWDKIKAWWKANGTFISVVVIIAIVAAGGWRWYDHHKAQRNLNASVLYYQFAQTWAQSQRKGAEAIANNLINNYDDTPYAAQTVLVLAGHEASSDDFEQATVHLQWVIHHASDVSLQRLARVRLARVQIANKKPQAALQTLAEGKADGFKPIYAQVRGDAYRALDKPARAHAAYTAALAAHTDDMGDTSLLKMKLQATAAVPSETTEQ